MDKDTLYIDLKEILNDNRHKLGVKPKTIIKLLDKLHIDEEYEVVITGNYGEWGHFFDFIFLQVMDGKNESEY